MVAAHMAAGASALRAACEAVYDHGLAADAWPAGLALTASGLARRAGG
jgi:NAD(P)H-hydrate repair Nnr-like enzyme with NAD(P)H-hydrate dehydratase domain